MIGFIEKLINFVNRIASKSAIVATSFVIGMILYYFNISFVVPFILATFYGIASVALDRSKNKAFKKEKIATLVLGAMFVYYGSDYGADLQEAIDVARDRAHYAESTAHQLSSTLESKDEELDSKIDDLESKVDDIEYKVRWR